MRAHYLTLPKILIANKRRKTDYRKRFQSLPLKSSAALSTESHRVSFIQSITFLSCQINHTRKRFFLSCSAANKKSGSQLNKKTQTTQSQADYLLPSLNHCLPLFQVIVKRHSSEFFFLSVGISNKVKLYFCTENSKPGFDFLARNRSSMTHETTSRTLPISRASAENFQPRCTSTLIYFRFRLICLIGLCQEKCTTVPQ